MHRKLSRNIYPDTVYITIVEFCMLTHMEWWYYTNF